MYNSSGHKGGLRAPFRAFGGPKTSKFQYRLYADGTIYDQEINQVVGYMEDNLDEVYRMTGRQLQRTIKEFLLK